MKRLFILSVSIFFASSAFGQSINEKELGEIRGSFRRDAATAAIQNVLTGNKDIRTNALNRELQGKIDHYFKYRVKVNGVTDQKSSGRCWMFTSMNVLRPSVMEMFETGSFDFSQNYLYFWDMLEKSNLFLENVISTAKQPVDDRLVEFYFKSPVADGGVWSLFYNVAHKYGLVPKSVMPETEHSENTSQMCALVNEKLRREGMLLREAAAKGKKETELRVQKVVALKDIYRILALCLGEPVNEFTWRFKDGSGNIVEKKFTPKEFYTQIIPDDYSPDNYVMIMNDPTREYYKVYEIQNNRNTVEGINWVYLNLPNEDIKRAAMASIMNNEAMYASCDVGKQHNSKTGISDPSMYDFNSLFGVDFGMDKKTRILSRQSGSSHAMTLIGVDTDADGKPVKWEFENSWGASAGHNGYITFTDEWFDEYMFRVVIHRRYLDEKAIRALNQKPVQLQPWDYMS